jgi:hypothetical protein
MGSAARVRLPRLDYLYFKFRFELASERSWLAARVSCEEVGMNNTEFFFDGPNGLLYFAGPAWTLLAVVVFLGLLFIAISRKNRS